MVPLVARFAAALAFAAVIATTTAHAGGDAPNVDRAAARAAYDEGARRYDLQEFRAALEAFKRAYLAWDNPAFLFNVAQCHRRLGEHREARELFRVYLERRPEGRDRAEVLQAIRELDVQLRASPAPTETPPAPREPRRSRAWVWGLVGGGAALAIGLGVGLGVGLTRSGGGDGFTPTLPDLFTLTVGAAR